MSVFDFPRIHISGSIQLNPGTANNEDYAADAKLPGPGPYGGLPLGLMISAEVAAQTYGMSDDAFVAWVQKEHEFEGSKRPIIPAEWNYYGDLSCKMTADMGTRVVGVQTGPNEVYNEATEGVPLSKAVGAVLTLGGGITDINPEGSPPATQFFIDHFELALGRTPLISGRLSKAVGQWINFYRNVNVQQDGGAGSYVYHAFPGAHVDLPGWNPEARGVIFRYYLFNAELADPANDSNSAIEKLYEESETNPKNLQIVGTFAPLLDEEIVSGPTGRLLIQDTPNLKTPAKTRNNGPNGKVALGPAVIELRGETLSADFSGTFPEILDGGTNDKWNFGPVTLTVGKKGSDRVEIGLVDYADNAAGDARGWLFDYDLSGNAAAMHLLLQDEATLQLNSPKSDTVLDETVLAETDYYFVSNQQAVYGEQRGPGSVRPYASPYDTMFTNNGTPEPITVKVYRRGQELTGDRAPTMTVWEYRTVPIENPGEAIPIMTTFAPGQPLAVDMRQSGCRLFTFAVNGPDGRPPAGFPPPVYSIMPPFVTNAPMISMRVLPNDEDFSGYYVDPEADEPVGNDRLTFDVVYEKVLRVYYLLFPTMKRPPANLNLSKPEQVAPAARSILRVTDPDPSMWLSTDYMPRTRDLSQSRRTLLQAWCRNPH